MKKIFEDDKNYLLLSQKIENKRSGLEELWESRELKNHIFIMSSGTTGDSKMKSFALGKEQVLANAKAVNEKIDASSTDTWLGSLPPYHIGGLSIYARAYLSGAKVVPFNQKWSPGSLRDAIKNNHINFLSLVPTQLFDIVTQEIKAPSCVKGVFVGGDFASVNLCKRARELGWPLLLTYGMTELCSQIATDWFENVKDGFIKVLPIHHLEEKEECLTIRSRSMFTELLKYTENSSTFHKSEESFILSDNAKLVSRAGEQFLKPLGRKGDVFKLSGRLYYLNELFDILSAELIEMDMYQKVFMSLKDDPRLGKKIVFNCLASIESRKELLENIIRSKLGFPRNYYTLEFTEHFDTTDLGKIKRN